MASNLSCRLLQRSASSAKALGNRAQRLSPSSSAFGQSTTGGPAHLISSSVTPISPRHATFSFASRLAKALSCGDSLMPLHSVTASVLLKSKLGSEVGQWGVLSEGFATPL